MSTPASPQLEALRRGLLPQRFDAKLRCAQRRRGSIGRFVGHYVDVVFSPDSSAISDNDNRIFTRLRCSPDGTAPA